MKPIEINKANASAVRTSDVNIVFIVFSCSDTRIERLASPNVHRSRASSGGTSRGRAQFAAQRWLTVPLLMTISTRRLFDRFSAVLLFTIGRLEPRPMALIFAGSTPRATR